MFRSLEVLARKPCPRCTGGTGFKKTGLAKSHAKLTGKAIRKMVEKTGLCRLGSIFNLANFKNLQVQNEKNNEG